MKYSYKWLRELSGVEKSAQEVAQELTLRSFEVEDVIDLSAGLDKVVVGEVREVVPHADADRLRVAMVDVGSDSLQIVCGAPNLAVGQKVAVALVGAKLPTADGSEFQIKKSKIRGVESCGMICAEDELGLGDNHEGIMVLSADAPVGEDFAQFMGLDDKVLDIDILPNRAHDCLSHIGVAREICAVSGQKFQLSADFAQNVDLENISNSNVVVDVQTDKCARYTATVIEGVDNSAETPTWLVARLRACGIKSISPIVDITNYVMLETGQPMHAFDVGKIANQNAQIKVGVRVAQGGEKLTLLDEAEIELNTDDVVIADGDDNLIALAGVMGGLASGVDESTTQILLEVAQFDASAVRATRSRHNLISEAAYRFERDIDPNLVRIAQARALNLIAQICGGAVVGMAECYPEPVVSWTVDVSVEYIGKLLGVQIEVAQIVEILELLDIAATQNGDILTCTIPTVRRDLRTAEDIIEEVGRIYGYDNITPKPLLAEVVAPKQNKLRNFEYVLRDFLSGIGVDEVKSYSFYARAAAESLGLDTDTHVSLANPMNPNQALMRRTLTAHLLEAARTNLTHSTNCAIYEIGKTYIPVGGDLPQEHLVCTLAVASKQTDGTQFFAIKGMVEQLLARVGLQDWRIVPATETEGFDAANYHPSRRALIKLADDTIIGAIGEATKKQLKYFGIKKARAATAEIDIDILRKSAASDRFFEPISKFPAVSRDLSMIVPARLPVADVERVLYDSAKRVGDLVTDIDLFDLYINPENEERSMAFRITLAHPERTLTNAEIDTAITTMISAVEDKLDVSVRTS